MKSEGAKALVRKRAAVKAKITTSLKDSENATPSRKKVTVDLVKKYLVDVMNFDEAINELICEAGDGENFETDSQAELDSQVTYAQTIALKLEEI